MPSRILAAWGEGAAGGRWQLFYPLEAWAGLSNAERRKIAARQGQLLKAPARYVQLARGKHGEIESKRGQGANDRNY